MSQIALFHSVLGVRPGVAEAATRLRAAGHEVHVVDQYDGRVFDDYDEAMAHAESIGYPELMRRAEAGVASLADGFVAVGFSNGAGMAEYVATRRPLAGVVLISGALPLEMIGAGEWPAAVAVQLHRAEGDPFHRQEWLDSLLASVRAAGAPLERFEYPGDGHLFADPSRPAEYRAEAAELLWERVIAFEPLAPRS